VQRGTRAASWKLEAGSWKLVIISPLNGLGRSRRALKMLFANGGHMRERHSNQANSASNRNHLRAETPRPRLGRIA
jgi:hypothetical protein